MIVGAWCTCVVCWCVGHMWVFVVHVCVCVYVYVGVCGCGAICDCGVDGQHRQADLARDREVEMANRVIKWWRGCKARERIERLR